MYDYDDDDPNYELPPAGRFDWMIPVGLLLLLALSNWIVETVASLLVHPV